ncbi:hypothetical protein EDD18DRAFT_1060848, partial [Armillaria luteobubalina]
GIFCMKFFWDFVGGIIRDPGGIQPAPGAAVFISLIVKAPVIQIFTMITRESRHRTKSVSSVFPPPNVSG